MVSLQPPTSRSWPPSAYTRYSRPSSKGCAQLTPSATGVVNRTVCRLGPFHTSETRRVTVASLSPAPMTVIIVPPNISVSGGGFTRSTTSPEITASEPAIAFSALSFGPPSTAHMQAEAQSGSSTVRARATETRQTSGRTCAMDRSMD